MAPPTSHGRWTPRIVFAVPMQLAMHGRSSSLMEELSGHAALNRVLQMLQAVACALPVWWAAALGGGAPWSRLTGKRTSTIPGRNSRRFPVMDSSVEMVGALAHRRLGQSATVQKATVSMALSFVATPLVRLFLRASCLVLPQLMLSFCGFSIKLCSERFSRCSAAEAISADLVFMLVTATILARALNQLAWNDLRRVVMQVATEKQLLVLCSICFMISGAQAQNQTIDIQSCKLRVDPNVWEPECDYENVWGIYVKAAAVSLLTVGGAEVARRMINYRRQARAIIPAVIPPVPVPGVFDIMGGLGASPTPIISDSMFEIRIQIDEDED